MNPPARPPNTAPAPRLGRYALVALALIVVALLAGLLPRRRARQELAQLTRELAVSTVIVVSPKPGTPEPMLALPAEARPEAEAAIFARAGGYVKHWLADLGTSVTNGQLLAEIDAPELNQQLLQARADLALAEAAHALAQTTADRWRELRRNALISEQEASEKLGELATRAAAADSARANVRRLEELQSFERVVAPFDGTITARNLDVGQLIVAGAGRELFHLAQTRTLRVFTRVPQTLAGDIAPGVIAELIFAELPGRTFTAKIVRTAGALDPGSRTLLTELAVDNARGEILAGAFGQVRFPTTAGKTKLTLPSNTLLIRAEGPFVGLVDAHGKVELRPVKLGHEFATSIEVLDGVGATERVILNPSDSLLSGTTVRVVEPSRPEAR